MPDRDLKILPCRFDVCRIAVVKDPRQYGKPVLSQLQDPGGSIFKIQGSVQGHQNTEGISLRICKVFCQLRQTSDIPDGIEILPHRPDAFPVSFLPVCCGVVIVAEDLNIVSLIPLTVQEHLLFPVRDLLPSGSIVRDLSLLMHMLSGQPVIIRRQVIIRPDPRIPQLLRYTD